MPVDEASYEIELVSVDLEAIPTEAYAAVTLAKERIGAEINKMVKRKVIGLL